MEPLAPSSPSAPGAPFPGRVGQPEAEVHRGGPGAELQETPWERGEVAGCPPGAGRSPARTSWPEQPRLARRTPSTRTSLGALHSRGWNTHSRTLGSRWASERRSLGITEGGSANTLSARRASHPRCRRSLIPAEGGRLRSRHGLGPAWGLGRPPLARTAPHRGGASGRQREVVRPGIAPPRRKEGGGRAEARRGGERARGKSQSRRKGKAGESSRDVERTPLGII